MRKNMKRFRGEKTQAEERERERYKQHRKKKKQSLTKRHITSHSKEIKK